MTWFNALLLLLGGAFAGGVNATAGGGSMLTVPLLELAGVPATAANGSNRVGIVTSNLTSLLSFRNEGVRTDRNLAPIILPGLAGALVGSYGITRLFDDDGFKTFFGLLMIPLILLTIFKPKTRETEVVWSVTVTSLVFFGIGMYAGAVQAGVGLVLLTALSRAGIDLVTANMIKVIFTLCVTCVALVVFIASGDVRWGPAFILAVGLSLGGWFGAKFAVRGGEKWIRVVMVAAAIALALNLLFG